MTFNVTGPTEAPQENGDNNLSAIFIGTGVAVYCGLFIYVCLSQRAHKQGVNADDNIDVEAVAGHDSQGQNIADIPDTYIDQSAPPPPPTWTNRTKTNHRISEV